MKNDNGKFRLRLNLFDAIILLLALVVGAFLLWSALKPDTASITTPVAQTETVTYTIRLNKTVPGTGDMITAGDSLTDAIKNFQLGQVVSYTVSPAVTLILDEDAQSMVYADVPGRENVDIVVSATATGTDGSLLVGSGYELKVGAQIFVRGPGYMGGGYVVNIDREG